MKLLNYTTKYQALLLLPLITIWAVMFYYAMLDEIYDSLDDGLENQKMVLVQRVATDPLILSQNDEDFVRHIYNFTPISKNTFENFQESYRDTLMYRQNEMENEPVRVYESALQHEGGFYKLKIITSMVEEDDLIEHLIIYLIGLYVLLVVSILILNNLLLRRIWKPFYGLISQLRNFRIERNNDFKTPESNIEEFHLLNDTVSKLIKKSTDSFIAQKQFIENASHELQTPLAISINKLELFLENYDLKKKQVKDVDTVLDNLGKLTRMNKSLLLLSKIENHQYEKEEQVDLISLTDNIVKDFDDMADHKKMKIVVITNGLLRYQMNEDLATILLTNLIKNTLIHGKKKESVQIKITPDSWQIRNFGEMQELNQLTLFTRFKKTDKHKKSTGLGLAIVKAIVDRYGLKLDYQFEGTHTFRIDFPS